MPNVDLGTITLTAAQDSELTVLATATGATAQQLVHATMINILDNKIAQRAQTWWDSLTAAEKDAVKALAE